MVRIARYSNCYIRNRISYLIYKVGSLIILLNEQRRHLTRRFRPTPEGAAELKRYA